MQDTFRQKLSLTGVIKLLKAHGFSLKLVNMAFVLISVITITFLSWYYMLFEMTMNMEPIGSWSLYDVFMLFLMWAIMMAGMMLPSATPMILLIDSTNKKRLQDNQAYTATGYFILGYLMAWVGFSVVVTLFQYLLHHAALLNPMMLSENQWFSSTVIVGAGLYQWSNLKEKCLNHCREPLSFLSIHWQEGIGGALKLGLKHGIYCIGCCWLLMLLLFVTGVMNIKWILILTIIVFIEKLMPQGKLIARCSGVVMIIYGVSLIYPY